jgi:hypothetical protein
MRVIGVDPPDERQTRCRCGACLVFKDNDIGLRQMENYSIPMPFIECPKCGAEIPLRRDWKLRKKYHDFLKAKVPQLVRDLQ